MVVLGRIIDAFSPNVRVVSVQGGPDELVEGYQNFWPVDINKIDWVSVVWLVLFQTMAPKTASSVFRYLDPYYMTEFIVNRLKEAESCDWMASRPALKKAIIGSLVMPELFDVVAKIVGVWPLIVPYLKETRRKDVGDSLVVWSLSFEF